MSDPNFSEGLVKQTVENLESLEAEKADINERIKEVLAEAKGNGLDTKVLKKVVAERKVDPNKLSEEEAIKELYKSAIGMA